MSDPIRWNKNIIRLTIITQICFLANFKLLVLLFHQITSHIHKPFFPEELPRISPKLFHYGR